MARPLIRIEDNTVRGMYRSFVGQQIVGWLPKGLYRFDRVAPEGVVIERPMPSGWARYFIAEAEARRLGFSF